MQTLPPPTLAAILRAASTGRAHKAIGVRMSETAFRWYPPLRAVYVRAYMGL